MQIRLYRDEQGMPRAEVEPPREVVGWWLEQDMQQDSALCEELLGILETVQSGRVSDWEGTGNAHTLTITSQTVRIESEFAEPPAAADLSLDELKEALTQWRSFTQPATT